MFAIRIPVSLKPTTVAARTRSKVPRVRFTVSAAFAPDAKNDGGPKAPAKFTTGGGGVKELLCNIEDMKAAIKECEGLEVDRLEACYMQFGCDLKQVTDHYVVGSKQWWYAKVGPRCS